MQSFKYKKLYSDPFTIIKFLLNCKQKQGTKRHKKWREWSNARKRDTKSSKMIYFFLMPNKPSGRNFSSWTLTSPIELLKSNLVQNDGIVSIHKKLFSLSFFYEDIDVEVMWGYMKSGSWMRKIVGIKDEMSISLTL